MHYTYILKNWVSDKFYIGHTNDLRERLNRHNSGKVKSTRNYRPWIIIYNEEFNNKNDAYKREMQIKSYKKGEAFKKLIK